jgi:hypothetical protein
MVTGKMVSLMELELNKILMDQDMKDNGCLEKLKEKEVKHLLMEQFLKVNGKIVNL